MKSKTLNRTNSLHKEIGNQFVLISAELKCHVNCVLGSKHEQELGSNKLKNKSQETETWLSNLDEDDPSFPRLKTKEGVIHRTGPLHS